MTMNEYSKLINSPYPSRLNFWDEPEPYGELKTFNLGHVKINVRNDNNKHLYISKINFVIEPDGKFYIDKNGYEEVNNIQELREKIKQYMSMYKSIQGFCKEFKIQGDFE